MRMHQTNFYVSLQREYWNIEIIESLPWEALEPTCRLSILSIPTPTIPDLSGPRFNVDR